jgi:hypothetical protein
MKRLSPALIFGLVIVSFCFTQEIQIGNASYNSSKGGFTISHSSLSFNTRVKVTNLRNSRFVEAVVNGRIPISADRIVDISRDAGDALGIDKNVMTLVQIETLPAGTEASLAPSSAPAAIAEPVPPQSAPPSIITQTQVLPLQTVTEYVQVPAAVPAGPCCNARLILAIFLLLILVIAILVVMLVLLLRRLPPWPWHYPLWLRRRYRRVKKFRKRLVPWLY